MSHADTTAELEQLIVLPAVERTEQRFGLPDLLGCWDELRARRARARLVPQLHARLREETDDYAPTLMALLARRDGGFWLAAERLPLAQLCAQAAQASESPAESEPTDVRVDSPLRRRPPAPQPWPTGPRPRP